MHEPTARRIMGVRSTFDRIICLSLSKKNGALQMAVTTVVGMPENLNQETIKWHHSVEMMPTSIMLNNIENILKTQN